MDGRTDTLPLHGRSSLDGQKTKQQRQHHCSSGGDVKLQSTVASIIPREPPSFFGAAETPRGHKCSRARRFIVCNHPSIARVRAAAISGVAMGCHKPFVGFWQPRKAGLNKHTGKSCIHKIYITANDLVQIE